MTYDPLTVDICLPYKLSGLIQCAADDMRRIQRKHRKYTIDADVYHTIDRDGYCRVNLAGCVMARTLRAPRAMSLIPEDFKVATAAKLLCLESVKFGLLGDAMQCYDNLREEGAEASMMFKKRFNYPFGWYGGVNLFIHDSLWIADWLKERGY